MVYTSKIKFPEQNKWSLKIIKFITFGLIFFLISFLFPISNKTGNNFFYSMVLLPFLLSLLTKGRTFYSTGSLFPIALISLTIMLFVTTPHNPVKAIKYFIYLVSFWVVASTLVRENVIDIEKLAILMMFASLLFSLALFFVHLFIKGYPLSSRPNLHMIFRLGNPIMASMLLTFFTTTGIAILIDKKKYLISVIILILSISMQVLLQTRTGLAGYLGAFLALSIFILFSSQNIKEKIRIAIAFAAIISLLFLALRLGIFDRLIERGSSHRIELYIITISEYLKNCNFLFGCGINYELSSVLNNGTAINHPHSIYSSQLIYFGILSLICILALQTKALLLFISKPNPWLYGFVAASVCFLFDGSKLYTNPGIEWLFFWFPLAILDGLTAKTFPTSKKYS
ncbi:MULTISPECIES: O-antigen ligase family protein [unclassified Endozoicomonas]|uniref:O-antigen ligase family protein n=1 Tax=unclassified Endozoicomonas TaxID=2644528 RepID=UPI003BB78493